ncbi:acyl carrier protein [Streptomyces sp. NPDC048650]|uniref:acyl carrier protein n=1 Tax=unclassified Streptomyces TaxID=2593676 RepID=UPI00371C6C4E
METVYDHLVTVLTEKFEVDAEEIGPDVSPAALELDSLAVVELYVTLQEYWQVPLEEDESAAELTLRQIARSVAAQLPGDRAPSEHGTPR